MVGLHRRLLIQTKPLMQWKVSERPAPLAGAGSAKTVHPKPSQNRVAALAPTSGLAYFFHQVLGTDPIQGPEATLPASGAATQGIGLGHLSVIGICPAFVLIKRRLPQWETIDVATAVMRRGTFEICSCRQSSRLRPGLQTRPNRRSISKCALNSPNHAHAGVRNSLELLGHPSGLGIRHPHQLRLAVEAPHICRGCEGHVRGDQRKHDGLLKRRPT